MLMQVDPSIMQMTKEYLRIIFWGLMFTFLYNFFSRAFILGHKSGHSVGDILLRRIGEIIDPVYDCKSSCHRYSHGIYNSLYSQLSQLNGSLLVRTYRKGMDGN